MKIIFDSEEQKEDFIFNNCVNTIDESLGLCDGDGDCHCTECWEQSGIQLLVDEDKTAQDKSHRKKPPLGITPRKIWLELRMREIIRAINDYCEAKMIVPTEWCDELIDISKELYEKEKEE